MGCSLLAWFVQKDFLGGRLTRLTWRRRILNSSFNSGSGLKPALSSTGHSVGLSRHFGLGTPLPPNQGILLEQLFRATMVGLIGRVLLFGCVCGGVCMGQCLNLAPQRFYLPFRQLGLFKKLLNKDIETSGHYQHNDDSQQCLSSLWKQRRLSERQTAA